MPDPSHPADFSESMRSRVQQAVGEYIEAWRGYRTSIDEVMLSTFLPACDDPLRLPVLLELLPIDLAQRWKRGEKTLLEHYLASYPELGSAQDLPVELIAAEYRIRRLQGDPLRIEGYRHRFPKQFDALVELVGRLKAHSNSSPRDGSPFPLNAPSSATPGPSSPVANPSSSPVPLWAQGTLTPGDSDKETIARKVMPGGEGYQLQERIGRGMFGEVWRAEAPGGIEVAVKIIHRTAGDQLTQVELRALELMKRLRHPFLLQVQAYWLSGDQLHIVMDLADKTLMDRLEECRRDGLPGIPAEELLTYMREAAEALDFLHGNQVLHRDVKPANILLAKGHARLADFGLARLFKKGGVDFVATMIGTPLYMGPEVWEQKVGPESDQYSLAATYVELRLGRPLFDVESQDEVKLSHLNSAPDLQGLPPAERKVIQRALAKKRRERYATCSQFAQALETCILGPAKRNPWLTRRQAVIALGVGAVACAGIAEIVRRQKWLRLQGLEVSAPSGIEIVAGEEKSFEIHVLGARDPSAAKPEFSGVPEGVTFQRDAVPRPSAEVGVASAGNEDADIWRMKVSAELNLPKANYGLKREVVLSVVDGQRTAERIIPLRIDPPVMSIPPECEPAAGAKRKRVGEEKSNYWDRIVRKLPENVLLPSGKSCELVLIPYNRELKLPSFYMMTNKVWNELFAVFDQQYVNAHPRPKMAKAGEADVINDAEEWPDAWRVHGAAKGAEDMPAEDYPLHPVMGATFRQAEVFAKWLGGALPTCQQWDTAAGLYLPSASKQQGPFLGVWKKGAASKLAIAVGGSSQGTVPITDADADLSPFGCRHMAGNGGEWTRDTSRGAFGLVTLRGRQYRQDRPLFYSDLRDEDKRTKEEIEDMTVSNPYIGFRIVIELKHPHSIRLPSDEGRT